MVVLGGGARQPSPGSARTEGVGAALHHSSHRHLVLNQQQETCFHATKVKHAAKNRSNTVEREESKGKFQRALTIFLQGVNAPFTV